MYLILFAIIMSICMQYAYVSGVWAQAYNSIWNSVSNFLGSILPQWILGSTLQIIRLAQQALPPTEISCHLSINTFINSEFII